MQAAGDSVVLSGEVTGPVAQETALSLANSFGGGKKEKVVNLLHIGGVQQVMVEVRLAEPWLPTFDSRLLDCLLFAIYNRGWTFSGGGYAQAVRLKSIRGGHDCGEVGIPGGRPGDGMGACGYGRPVTGDLVQTGHR